MHTKEDILTMVEDDDVRFIRLQFTDMLGHMRNMAITASGLMNALDNNYSFDGSAIKGFVTIDDSDLYLRPDPDTFTIFPWRPHHGKVARMICDVYKPDGTPLESDPRYILHRVINEAAADGYKLVVSPECEFYLFNTDEDGNPTMTPNDKARYLELAPLDNGENCRREICLTLEEMGYVIEASHHEMSPGQHEIVFKGGDVLTTADRIVTFRNVVKTLANRSGLHATFMPKPISGEWGSGMHLEMQVLKDGKNIFYNEEDPSEISDAALKFVGGLLKYSPDMACVTNPTVNSYKRFTPGFEAPCYLSWSRSNRSLLVRTPELAKADRARIELRSPDLTANPYVALAACFKAGLRGIKENITPPSEINVNLYELSEEERTALGVERLPISLNEALMIARKSSFITDLLGDVLKKKYLRAKSEEYDEYRTTINQWEIERYFVRY